MAQIRLSAFTDAVHPDFEQALDLLATQGFSAVELRSHVFDQNIADLGIHEAQKVAKALQRLNLHVSCLWTPLFTHLNSQPLSPTLDDEARTRLGHYLDLAELLNAPILRVVSPQPAPKSDADEQANVLCDLLHEAADAAAERWKRLVLENKPGTFTSSCAQLGRTLYRADHPSLGVAWNMATAWQAGEYPDPEHYAYVSGMVGHLYIQGGRSSKADPKTFATFALPGHDDMEHPVLLGLLLRDDYEGYATIDPHYSGFAPEDQIKNVNNGSAEAVFRTADYLRQTAGAA